jgi:membrane protein implicated in regulation of membrane protease activity
MNPKLLRLTVAAALFAAWMGYLSYLVYALPRALQGNDLPLELSRPQILVSDLDIVGAIEDKEGQVKVNDVLYASKDQVPPEKGTTIKVVNLESVRKLVKVKDINGEHWEERKPAALDNLATLGPCLLPLKRTYDGTAFQVVPLPPAPGTSLTSPRIYPAIPEVLAEYRSIQKQKE